MPKMLPVTVSFVKEGQVRLRRLKATCLSHAREVVCKALNLAAFVKKALNEKLICHVYFNGRVVPPIDDVTCRLELKKRRDERRLDLRPKRREKHKHERLGIRHLFHLDHYALA